MKRTLYRVAGPLCAALALLTPATWAATGPSCSAGQSNTSSSDSYEYKTNWSGQTLTLNQFNPALGTLIQAFLTIGGRLSSIANARNDDNAVADIDFQFKGKLTATAPATISGTYPTATVSGNIDTTDNFLNVPVNAYVGYGDWSAVQSPLTQVPCCSGANTSPSSSSPKVVNLTPTTINITDSGVLAALTGTLGSVGTFNYTAGAQGGTTISAFGNITTQASTSAKVTVSVIYCYTAPPGSLGDLVWEDKNHNGVQDDEEPGMDGVTLNLTGDSTKTATTSLGGKYSFTNLAAGTYNVAVDESTLPATHKWKASPSLQGGDTTKDSNGNPANSISLDIGEDKLTIDFSYYHATGTIGDRIWTDTNSNGIQDSGEPGIDGVTVKLYKNSDCTGEPFATQITPQLRDLSNNLIPGSYLFTELEAGNYCVAYLSAPTNYTLTTSGVGSDRTVDSSAQNAQVNLVDDFSIDTTNRLWLYLSGSEHQLRCSHFGRLR